jgi:two-component system CheB/CheR fusion protein
VAYAATLVLTLLALAVTQLLQDIIGFPTVVLLIPVVILSGVRFGARVGLFSMLIAAGGLVFAIESEASPLVTRSAEWLLVLAFVAVAAISLLIAGRQHQLERQMGANEAELRAVFDLAAVGTGMVDARTSRFLRVNEQLCRMTGFTREELLTRTVPDITHPDDRERDREIIRGLLTGAQERWSVEKRYVRKDGEVVWVLVNGTLIHGIRGQGSHVIAHAADITDRRRTDDALRDANRLKDEFLATLSHELRTPLNVVAGWTSILQRDLTSQEHVRRGLSVIERNTESLRRLTDDLIGMSSVLTGRVRLERRLVDLRTVLDDAVESITLAGQAKGLTIRTDFEDNLPVRGDEARLRQVFWNLLSNAVKFTDAGGTIRAAAHVRRDVVVVEVADSGIGIPAEFLPHVFDKFRQEDASHTRAHQGLGLGLTIARQFTELHGGTIAATSPGRNQGAVFTVTLPVAQAAPEDAKA